MDANVPTSSAGDKSGKLTRLVFDKPDPTDQGYYVTSAGYTNDDRQRFRLHVQCRNTEALDRYTPAVYAHFKLRPASPEEARSQDVDQSGDIQGTSPAQQTPPDEREQSPDLDISIHVDDTGGIEPPYILDFTIDPKIGRNETHIYGISNVNRVNMNATGVRKKVEVTFQSITPRSAVVLENNLSVDPAFHDTRDTPFSFTLKVRGMENDSQYTLNGDITRLVASAETPAGEHLIAVVPAPGSS
jgi:hypothetical protein